MNKEAFRKRLKKRIKVNRLAFEGTYQSELNSLLGLSKSEIDKITPGITDLKTYEQLITIVKEASAHNISQAQLKSHIQDLGAVGVKIARKIPKLSDLLS